MDLLKQIATPQSTEHVHLLLVMLNIVVVVLLPYLGFLAGCSALSLWYRRRARATRSAANLRFARALIDAAVFSKSGVTFLLIIPALSLVFIFAQILQSSESIAVGLMAYGSVALLVAAVLLYAYKYTFRLEGILERMRERPAAESAGLQGVDLQDYLRSNERSTVKAGRYGFLALLLGSLLTIGSLSLVVDPSTWSTVDSAFELLIAPGFLIRYAQFVAIALGATGVGILYFLLSRRGGMRETGDDYDNLVRSVGLRFSILSLLLQPVLILLLLMVLPGVALSGLVFLLVGLGLLSLFATAHFLYAYRRDNRPAYIGYAFGALLLALFFLFTKDQVAISNATRQHAAKLAVMYDRDIEELKGRLGIAVAVMSGQDIYNAKCSACHMFDQKKVGPPYQEVVPKYEGKKALLVAFVLNPVKVNAAYPPMPNQGLKPAEADSIATYLLAKYANPSGAPTTTQAPSK